VLRKIITWKSNTSLVSVAFEEVHLNNMVTNLALATIKEYIKKKIVTTLGIHTFKNTFG
jgi:hypothetical protein